MGTVVPTQHEGNRREDQVGRLAAVCWLRTLSGLGEAQPVRPLAVMEGQDAATRNWQDHKAD
jgi:hypothetical protein